MRWAPGRGRGRGWRGSSRRWRPGGTPDATPAWRLHHATRLASAAALVFVAPVRTGRFPERIRKPDAGSRSISLVGSSTAGNRFNCLCRAIAGNYVQACPCILRRQWACGVWGRRRTRGRVCPGVALRRGSCSCGLRRWGICPRRRSGERWRRADRFRCLLLS